MILASETSGSRSHVGGAAVVPENRVRGAQLMPYDRGGD